MARTVATLPAGSWITDYISLGVITKTFPLTTVRSVLAASGKASLRCQLEGLQWPRQVGREQAW